MGTPEFPDLGKHCSVDDCKQIDFLPFTCDRCSQEVCSTWVDVSDERESYTVSLQQNQKKHRLHSESTNVKVLSLHSYAMEVFCLQHRGYTKHLCPNANQKDVTVLVCPLCAKSVRLVPNEDPNITWESHVNSDCDPSNYQKATKKKRCPVPGCKETLTFSNTIRCRDCTKEHCLKHRFGPDHKCIGPKKPDPSFPFVSLLRRSQKGESISNRAPNGSSWWGSSFLNAASNAKASAEAGMLRLSNATTQAFQKARDGIAQSSSSGALVEQCAQCQARFSTVSDLIEHAERCHQNTVQLKRNGVTIDICPKCSKGFQDPVLLVEHVERDHGGTSKVVHST